MMTIQDMLGATQPIHRAEIEQLLEQLGYQRDHKNGSCEVWGIAAMNRLQIPLDAMYATPEAADMFPADYVQGMAGALLRHQRIVAKGAQVVER